MIFLFFRISFKHIERSVEKLKSKTNDDTDLTLLQSLIMEKGMDISSAMVTVSDMMMAGIDTVRKWKTNIFSNNTQLLVILFYYSISFMKKVAIQKVTKKRNFSF